MYKTKEEINETNQSELTENTGRGFVVYSGNLYYCGNWGRDAWVEPERDDFDPTVPEGYEGCHSTVRLDRYFETEAEAEEYVKAFLNYEDRG